MDKIESAKYIATHFNTPNEEYWTEKVEGVAKNPHKLVMAAGLVVAVATPIVLAVSALALSIFALVTVNPFLLTGATCAVFLIAASTPAALLSALNKWKGASIMECLKSCNYAQFHFERQMKADGFDKRREEFEDNMRLCMECIFIRIERETTSTNGDKMKAKYRGEVERHYNLYYQGLTDPELQKRLDHYLARIDLLVTACTAA